MRSGAENPYVWLRTPFAIDACQTSCVLNEFNWHTYLITLLLVSLPSVDKALQQALQGGWRRE